MTEYLITDKSDKLVEGKTLKSFEATVPRVSHAERVCELFAQARETGIASCEPEEGLRYAVGEVEILQSHLGSTFMFPAVLAKPIAWYVTSAGDYWPQYIPYMLSLRSPADAVAFAGGRFRLMVFASGDHIVNYCRERGYSVEFLGSGSDEYVLEIKAGAGRCDDGHENQFRLPSAVCY